MNKPDVIPCSCLLGWWFLVGLLVVGAFVAVVRLAYVPSGESPNQEMGAQRKAYRAELEAVQENLATTYGWEDQEAGVVRLPIERAMELTAQELQP